MVKLEININANLLDGMANPSQVIADLIYEGMKELKIKFPSYGNSYIDTKKLDLKFWKKRLSNEIMEYKRCITPEERTRKLANLFNLVWMAYYYETNPFRKFDK